MWGGGGFHESFGPAVHHLLGGASGIGKATVDRLSEEGASVAIFDVNKEAGEAVAAQLSAAGRAVEFCHVDVSKKEDCMSSVNAVAKKHGGTVNYLVNCAAYFGSKGVTAEKEDWDKSFAVNVQGYANMVQSCIEPMKTVPGREGKAVVNIASISGHRAQPVRWTYSATKGAVLAMTRCMALDLSVANIRVNSVSPAWVWSPEVAKAAQGDRAKWEPLWGPFHMTRRLAETSEIAAAICFLLSDDASFITATDLPIDGGYMGMGPETFGEKSSFAGTEY